MADNTSPNGADAGDGRERPSWYIPIEPIPKDDHRTTIEVLLETLGRAPKLSEETQKELAAYLDQFRVPRQS